MYSSPRGVPRGTPRSVRMAHPMVRSLLVAGDVCVTLQLQPTKPTAPLLP